MVLKRHCASVLYVADLFPPPVLPDLQGSSNDVSLSVKATGDPCRQDPEVPAPVVNYEVTPEVAAPVAYPEVTPEVVAQVAHLEVTPGWCAPVAHPDEVTPEVAALVAHPEVTQLALEKLLNVVDKEMVLAAREVRGA